MHFEVEKSGCSEWLGMVQVRYCLYLDPGDHGYERHHVAVDDEKGGKVERDNPFHNHFVQFQPEEATEENIMFVGELALEMAKEKWLRDEVPNVKNIPIRLDHLTFRDGRPSCAEERSRVACEKVKRVKEMTFKAVKKNG